MTTRREAGQSGTKCSVTQRSFLCALAEMTRWAGSRLPHPHPLTFRLFPPPPLCPSLALCAAPGTARSYKLSSVFPQMQGHPIRTGSQWGADPPSRTRMLMEIDSVYAAHLPSVSLSGLRTSLIHNFALTAQAHFGGTPS